MSVSDERVDYLLTLIRAIAREEAQNAANNPTEQWEPIDPDAAADNYRAALDHIIEEKREEPSEAMIEAGVKAYHDWRGGVPRTHAQL